MAISKRKKPASWKTTLKDVKEINRLLDEAGTAVNKAYVSLTEDAGFSDEQARSVLPILQSYPASNIEQLHGSFETRADFNREKSRLKRIITASKAKPRKGTISPAPDNASQLTSFFWSEEEGLGPTQYMNKETRFLKSQRNKRNLKELAERGIEFVRQVVTDAQGRPVYDENRHKVTVMVPKSRRTYESYMETIQKQPEIAVEVNPDAEGGYVEMFGDVVPAQEIGSPSQKRRLREEERKRREEERLYEENLRSMYEDWSGNSSEGMSRESLEHELAYLREQMNRDRYEKLFKVPSDDIPYGDILESLREYDRAREEERRERRKRWNRVWSPERLVREVSIDKFKREQTQRYFDNYMLIIDTVMPKEMAEKIRPVLKRALDMHPDDQYDLYRYIRDNGEDAATIEFLYLDKSQGAATKAKLIVNFWQNEVNRWMGKAPEKLVSAEEVQSWFDNSGMSEGLLAVDAEFNRKRTDISDVRNVKGKMRKQWWMEGHQDA